MIRRGKYIVIEGNDGTGKSTQVELLEKRLEQQGIEAIQIHEPDGAPMASKLRDLIKDGTLKREPWTNVMLFSVARRVSWFQHMKPSLQKGTWVLAARSWLSTVTYQGYGQKIPISYIERFTRDNVSEDYLTPDLTIILTMLDQETRKKRIEARGVLEKKDAFESMPDDFQERVNNGYIDYARSHGIETLDVSNLSKADVHEYIWERVEKLIKGGK